MTEDQFKAFAAAAVRHLLTLCAGVLAARGFTGSSDMVSNFAAAAAVFAATLAWSFIQKHKLLAELCGGANLSLLEQLLGQASTLKKNGADPLVVSHMVGTALAVASQELAAVSTPQNTIANADPATTTQNATAEAVAPAPEDSPSGSSPSSVPSEPDQSGVTSE